MTNFFLALAFYFSILFSATLIACKKTCFSERESHITDLSVNRFNTFNSLICSCAFKSMHLSLKEKTSLTMFKIISGEGIFWVFFNQSNLKVIIEQTLVLLECIDLSHKKLQLKTRYY